MSIPFFDKKHFGQKRILWVKKNWTPSPRVSLSRFQGPVSCKLGHLKVKTRQSGPPHTSMNMNFTISEHYFVSQIYQSPKRTCIRFFGCQHWTAEFKGITQPVLFMIFFYDFVTPQKRNMSEGCRLFTLEMAVQSLGNRDFTFRWFQPNMNTGKNH